MKVQQKSTIFANKLVAFLQRSANRDIFDIWYFFSKSFDIHEPLIKERTGKDVNEALSLVEKKLLSL